MAIVSKVSEGLRRISSTHAFDLEMAVRVVLRSASVGPGDAPVRCATPFLGKLGGVNGIDCVIGGALGNQVGNGDGRTAATIAGAVAGEAVFVAGVAGKDGSGAGVVTGAGASCVTVSTTLVDSFC